MIHLYISAIFDIQSANFSRTFTILTKVQNIEVNIVYDYFFCFDTICCSCSNI